MAEKLPIMAVLDTDTFNEVDDQFTLAYALLASETIDLRAESKVIHAALGGKGGGQPTMIQGSIPAKRAEIEAYFG